MKIKNLINGRTIAKTFPSSANVDEADVNESTMRLLYIDQSGWHFMDEITFEQCTMNEKEVGEEKRWLKEGVMATVVLWENRPISLVLDNFVELEVVECAPNVKGDTVSGGSKVAKVETGYEIRVPLFIESGDHIKIDTRTGGYVSRRKG
jgi:elongation factor P